jgi:hypothetical protein
LRVTVRPIPPLVFSKTRRTFLLLPGGEGRDEGGRQTSLCAKFPSSSSLTVSRMMYPGANILVAGKEDFESQNRKRLFSRISACNQRN